MRHAARAACNSSNSSTSRRHALGTLRPAWMTTWWLQARRRTPLAPRHRPSCTATTWPTHHQRGQEVLHQALPNRWPSGCCLPPPPASARPAPHPLSPCCACKRARALLQQLPCSSSPTPIPNLCLSPGPHCSTLALGCSICRCCLRTWAPVGQRCPCQTCQTSGAWTCRRIRRWRVC